MTELDRRIAEITATARKWREFKREQPDEWSAVAWTLRHPLRFRGHGGDRPGWSAPVIDIS
jgi:hypothetical protein